jgi:hypothetical protein
MIIPLMNINLPANVQSIFFSMNQIIRFDFFDSMPYEDELFEFKSDDNEEDFDSVKTSYGERFEIYGYEHMNMIQNMGTGFFTFGLLLAY